jgi:hypothetical protein
MHLKTKTSNSKKGKEYKKGQKPSGFAGFCPSCFFAVHSFFHQTHSFSKSVPTSARATQFRSQRYRLSLSNLSRIAASSFCISLSLLLNRPAASSTAIKVIKVIYDFLRLSFSLSTA